MGIHSLQVVLIQSQLTDIVVTDRVTDGLVGCRALVVLFNPVQHFGADTSLVLLCIHT